MICLFLLATSFNRLVDAQTGEFRDWAYKEMLPNFDNGALLLLCSIQNLIDFSKLQSTKCIDTLPAKLQWPNLSGLLTNKPLLIIPKTILKMK